MLEEYDDLLECEAELGQRLEEVSLIGQVEISRDDLMLLGLFISDLMSEGPRNGTKFLKSRTPVSLCFFMVWAGVYHYVPLYHDFWNFMHQHGGLPPSPAWQAQWGTIFLEVLREKGMPTFEEAGGLHYVTPILAQGGIPDECLHDFFDKLIWPIATGRLAVDVNDTDEIMREWQAKSSLFDFTDKPVRRFLIYGGKPAEDFLGRCIEMALSTIEDGVVPSADSLDIPGRIVEKFEVWHKGRDKRSERQATVRKSRFRSPRMILDPQYGEVVLELPTQVLEVELLKGDLTLQLASGLGETIEAPISYLRHGEAVESELIRITIPYPAEKYEAKLLSGGGVVKSWGFKGLTKEKPWLAFSGSRCECIRSGILPRSDVWLLYPVEVVIDGEISVIEEAGEVFGRWFIYRASHIDLSNADEINLRPAAEEGSDRDAYKAVRPIKVAAERFVEPELEMDNLVGLVTCSGAPVFERPPRISIPIPTQELNRWRLSIVPRHSPTHSSRIEASLTQAPSIKGNGIGVVLDLDQKNLLKGAIGEFLVRLRGPLGKDQRYSIAIIPGLELAFPQKLYTPGPNGASAVAFELLTKPLADCSVGLPCEMEIESDRCSITAPAEVSRVPVIVSFAGSSNSQIGLPLEVELPRMRIALRGLEKRPTWKWSNEKVSLNMLQWEDSADLSLLIETPGVEVGSVRLVLKGASHESTRQLDRGRAFFPLKSFSDSLRSLALAEADFVLDLDSIEITAEKVPVLSVQTQWVIESLDLIEELAGDERQLLMLFEEKTHVHSRCLRLWNLWRPWNKPLELRVPDDEQSLSTVIPAVDFPAGDYRIEFLVEDPWAAPTPLAFPPEEDGQTVFDVQIGDAEERELITDSKAASQMKALEKFSFTRCTGGDIEQSIEMLSGYSPTTDEELGALAAVLLSLLSDGWAHKNPVTRLWDSVLDTSIASEDQDFAEKFLGSLSKYTDGRDNAVKKRARLLCVNIGLLQLPIGFQSSGFWNSVRSSVTSMWPALGAIIELSFNGAGGASAIGQISSVLGEIPLIELLHLPTDEGMEIPAECAGAFDECLECRLYGKPDCGCAGIDYSPRYWGGTEARDLPTLLEKSYEVLNLIYGHLGLHPVGVLHEDSYLLALKQWLEFRQVANRRNVEFVERRLSHVERCMWELLTVPNMSPYVDALNARIPPDANQPLVYVPFLIGGIALAQRCAARGIYSPSGLPNLRAAGTEAYLLAPNLYVRDLCLSDLAVVVMMKDNEESEVEIGEP